MAKHTGRNPSLLDLGILVHDAADPTQVDIERLHRPAADDDAGRRSIIGHRIENLARVLQTRIDDLDRGDDIFGGAEHFGKADTGPLQGPAHDERELDLDPRPAIILVRNLGPVRDHHVVEEMPVIRLIDLRGTLHGLRGQADLVADQLRSGRQLALGYFGRDGVGILNVDIGPSRGELGRLLALLLRAHEDVCGFVTVGLGQHGFSHRADGSLARIPTGFHASPLRP